MAITITNKAQMKEFMKDEAKALVVRFCNLNNIRVPRLEIVKRNQATVRSSTCEGYYKNGGDIVTVIPGNTIFDNEKSARFQKVKKTNWEATFQGVNPACVRNLKAAIAKIA